MQSRSLLIWQSSAGAFYSKQAPLISTCSLIPTQFFHVRACTQHVPSVSLRPGAAEKEHARIRTHLRVVQGQTVAQASVKTLIHCFQSHCLILSQTPLESSRMGHSVLHLISPFAFQFPWKDVQVKVCPRQHLGLAHLGEAGEQPHRKGSVCSGQQQAEYQPAVCPGSQNG